MKRTVVLVVFLSLCLCGCLMTFTSHRPAGTTTDTPQERLDRREEDLPTPRMFGIDLQTE
jgi:hypothetical protein